MYLFTKEMYLFTKEMKKKKKRKCDRYDTFKSFNRKTGKYMISEI